MDRALVGEPSSRLCSLAMILLEEPGRLLSQHVKLAVADSWRMSVQELLGAETTGRGWWWCLDLFQRKYLEHRTRVVGMGPGKEYVRNVSKAKSMG